MTASVTMQMWHAISSAFWRPDPRGAAEPREPSYARLDTSQRRAAAPLLLLDASRLRCGSACPGTDPSARTSTALGEPPNVCTRMSSRLQKLSTVPLHELDAVMCTDLGGQHPAGGAAPGLRGNHCRAGVLLGGAGRFDGAAAGPDHGRVGAEAATFQDLVITEGDRGHSRLVNGLSMGAGQNGGSSGSTRRPSVGGSVTSHPAASESLDLPGSGLS